MIGVRTVLRCWWAVLCSVEKHLHSVSLAPAAMAILFAVVARGSTILAKHAWCGGNFLENFERSRAFTFLNEIKKRFQTTYGSRAQTALPYAMNSEFSSVLAAQLKYHSENKGPDQIVETQAQVDELKGIMVRNIDLVAQRGEKLELLIDKTENLVDSVSPEDDGENSLGSALS
ncbi:Vesicle-associated membrane protein 7, partial [Ophiophagus hannah]